MSTVWRRTQLRLGTHELNRPTSTYRLRTNGWANSVSIFLSLCFSLSFSRSPFLSLSLPPSFSFSSCHSLTLTLTRSSSLTFSLSLVLIFPGTQLRPGAHKLNRPISTCRLGTKCWTKSSSLFSSFPLFLSFVFSPSLFLPLSQTLCLAVSLSLSLSPFLSPLFCFFLVTQIWLGTHELNRSTSTNILRTNCWANGVSSFLFLTYAFVLSQALVPPLSISSHLSHTHTAFLSHYIPFSPSLPSCQSLSFSVVTKI